MVNVNKLKAKIIESGNSIESIADKIDINRATFYRKMRLGGSGFTVSEAEKISKVLSLSYDEVNSIFFA